MTKEELSVRKFAGNGDVLCDIGCQGCPFNNIIGETQGFCLLYKKILRYYETGNNDLCYRCNECKVE